MFFLVVVFDFLLRSCCTTCLANTFSTLPQDEMINSGIPKSTFKSLRKNFNSLSKTSKT